ncbi:MAG: Spy/CpxP family protein refolding chaperone [Leptospirillum sp.]|jgi:Spy/CpxP family protein refolding chaperone
MKLRRTFIGYFLILSAIFFSTVLSPKAGFADNASFDMNKFQSQMHSDFILPSVLATHPGPMFYFKNSKELNLSDQQLNKIKKITHKIIPKTQKQLKQIEALKTKYLNLMKSSNPSFHTSRKLLQAIGKLEAIATADHLEAHLACYKVLTPQQKRTLSTLLAKH